MEINVETVIVLYKEKLSNVEHDLIIREAQIKELQSQIDNLNKLLKDNNIDVVK